MLTTTKSQSRYSWGGDEHLVVQISEVMSLEANFITMAIVNLLTSRQLPGISDICPSNASFLIRFDPDVTPPADLEAAVRAAELEIGDSAALSLETRIFEKRGLHLAAVGSGCGAARWSGLSEVLRRVACVVRRGLEVP